MKNGWRETERDRNDTWVAGWMESVGNLIQLGQQVQGEFTRLSSSKCEAFIYAHTQMQQPPPVESIQGCFYHKDLCVTSTRWRETTMTQRVKRRHSSRYVSIHAIYGDRNIEKKGVCSMGKYVNKE